MIQAYKDYVEKLIKCLPMDDVLFTTQLSNHNLLPGNTSNRIGSLPTQPDKASYFLNHVIKPALDIDDVSSFNSLLSVMEHCDYAHVKKLACEIKSEIDKRSNTKTGVCSYVCINMYGYKSNCMDWICKNLDEIFKAIHIFI